MLSRVDGMVSGVACINMEMLYVIVGCFIHIVYAGVGSISAVVVSLRQAVFVLIIFGILSLAFLRKGSNGHGPHVVMAHCHGGISFYVGM